MHVWREQRGWYTLYHRLKDCRTLCVRDERLYLSLANFDSLSYISCIHREVGSIVIEIEGVRWVCDRENNKKVLQSVSWCFWRMSCTMYVCMMWCTHLVVLRPPSDSLFLSFPHFSSLSPPAASPSLTRTDTHYSILRFSASFPAFPLLPSLLSPHGVKRGVGKKTFFLSFSTLCFESRL